MVNQTVQFVRVKIQTSPYSFQAFSSKGRGVLAHQQNTEGRKVVRQHASFAVQNPPARRDHRQVAHPIAFSLIKEEAVLADLYPPISDQQPQEGQCNGVLEKSDFHAGSRSCSGNRTSIYLNRRGYTRAGRTCLGNPSWWRNPLRCLVRPG